ncbi:chemotaxis protein CheW [Vibrio marisflavi]|uniref:CheW-like domain-containing protein n=1 Tax=Vibrio marisflavi CECT 7928 TaxID=634439 RepID=A0ABM9A6K5_9VIBR|nr:chemotaxis protein CheW [Vibrio marisflavi]CAH0540763.1 hypothetical protein VMF7928_03104 [Vibrio marisflavi CECT 7928]
MSNDSWLSSEQALDNYFSALLDEETAVIEKDEPNKDHEPTFEPKRQPVAESSYYEAPQDEPEVPNLQDVERLLEQLETENIVDKLNLEEILEQNTDQIAISKQQAQSKTETVVEPEPVIEQELEAEAFDSAIEEVYEAPPIEVVEEETIEIIEEQVAAIEPEVETEVALEPELEAETREVKEWHNTARDESFQVLYFEVNAMTFAVPLDELGGIHKIGEELNHLLGRPDWYLGLQTNNDSQLDVVDTARWVMSEKLQDESYKDDYQYIVMLGSSMWGLASTLLKGTEVLDSEKVRWREQAGKRPWLAGMVKEKMCALIHVEALIAMLNAGLDVKALEK